MVNYLARSMHSPMTLAPRRQLHISGTIKVASKTLQICDPLRARMTMGLSLLGNSFSRGCAGVGRMWRELTVYHCSILNGGRGDGAGYISPL